MLVIDGDCAFMLGAMERDRDLTLPLEEVRTAPPSGRDWVPGIPDSEAVVSLPDFRRGGVALIVAKLSGRIYRPGSPLWGYRTGDIAYAMARGQAAYYRILDTRGEARVIETSGQLREHMAEWSAAEDYSRLPVGLIIGIEGADPILWPEQVHEWWEVGVRVVSLSHYGVSTYSHGTSTGTDGGLFPPAKDLLREMDALGMVLDVTHTSDESIRQAMDIFTGPRRRDPPELPCPRSRRETVLGRAAEPCHRAGRRDRYVAGRLHAIQARHRLGGNPQQAADLCQGGGHPGGRCRPHGLRLPASRQLAARGVGGPTWAAASAGAERPTGSTQPPTTTRLLESSHSAGTARRTYPTSCTATGSASTRSGCRISTAKDTR